MHHAVQLAMFVTVIRKQIHFPSLRLNERLESLLIDLSVLLQCSLCTLKLSPNYSVIFRKVLFIFLIFLCLHFATVKTVVSIYLLRYCWKHCQ